MTDRVIIEKGERNKSLSWRWTIRDGKNEVHFTCRCGASGPFTDNAISSEGDVTPSILHDHEECGFHAFITLKGYSLNGT